MALVAQSVCNLTLGRVAQPARQLGRYGTAEDILKDLRKYGETLQAEAAGVFNLRSLLKRLRRPVVAIPTAVVIVAIAALTNWFFNHQAKVRWAKQEALPEIEKVMAGGGARVVR